MLKDITIGQFFPGDSAVHRLDPRVKIVLTIAFIVLLFVANTPASYALILLFLAAVIGISRISPKLVVRGLKPILFIIIFTAVLNLFYTPGEMCIRDSCTPVTKIILRIPRRIFPFCGSEPRSPCILIVSGLK